MTAVAAKAIWLIGAIAWFVIRYPHQRRSRKTPVVKSGFGPAERAVLTMAELGLGFVPILYIVTGFPAFADRVFIPALAWCGAVGFLAALLLFLRTHRDLGRNWSMSLELRNGHTLVTNGIYGRIRHPMYAAFWLWAVAQFLLLPNWVAGPAGLVGFGTLFFYRVGREEQFMLEAFGETYRAYMRRTARLLPGIY